MELKEIISINTEQGAENLRTLRTEINELKAALFNLQKGSDEYNEVAAAVYQRQEKINDVMRDTRKPVADAAGSFNSLNSELRQLKEAWKATASDVDRAALGERINAVKAQINGMNESIGNFQHNVGNYTNSIVDAFNRMGIAATSIDNPLKKIGVDITSVTDYVKVMVVTFQQINIKNISSYFQGAATSVTSFVKSLSAVKAAVLGTGLGALLVLIGELIAHWDDLTDAVGRWIAKTNEGLVSADQIKKALEAQNKEINFSLELMRARGAAEQDITEMNILLIQQEIDKQRAIQEQNKELANNAFWWWTRVSAMRAYETGEDEITKLEAELDKLLDKQAILMKVLSERTDTATTSTNNYTAAQKKLTESVKEFEDEEGSLEDTLGSIDAAETAIEERRDEAAKKRYEDAKALEQELIDSHKTEEELEIEQYEKKKALLEEFHLSTEQLETDHLVRLEEIRKEQADREEEMLEIHRKKEEEDDKKREEDYKKLMNARKNATKSFVSSSSDLLSKLSLAMGENTKMGKGFAIASATIDTIASAVAGFRAGYNQWKDTGYMSFMAPIQGAINATAALVAGYAQVQKIRSVDTSGNDSGGGATATAIAMPNIEGLSSPVDYTRQVTTETEREEMNTNSRVYILESDIQESGNRVRIRENETTF